MKMNKKRRKRRHDVPYVRQRQVYFAKQCLIRHQQLHVLLDGHVDSHNDERDHTNYRTSTTISNGTNSTTTPP